MKYIKLTLQYLFQLDKGKRFFTLFLLALPSCFVLAYYFPITAYYDWFVNYAGNFASYGQLWLSLWNRDTLQIGILILGYCLLVLSVASMTTIISRSVRIGKFQLKSLFYLVNENFFPSFYAITFFIIAFLVLQSLLCLFLYLSQTIFNFLVGYISSIFFTLIVLFLGIMIFSTMIIWLPIMSFNGLKPFKALPIAYRKTRFDGKQIFLAYLFMVIIGIFLGALSFVFNNIFILCLLTNTISYTLITVYFITLNIISYFDIECITREDLIKYPYLRR